MFLLLISFLAGILTVLAPCILPLLPVIVGGTLSGDGKKGFNKRKAFTIIISLSVSVIIFTLLLKASTLFIDIPEYVWKWISGGIVVLLGLVTLFPSLWETRFMARLSTKSNILLGKGDQKKSFIGDIIIGAALGPVFSTCSPTYFIVLATVLPVNFFLGMTYLLSYVIGLGISLLLVSIVGQKIIDKLGVASDPRGWFKKILGIIFIIVGVAIIGGLDKKTQLFILDSGFFDVTKIEQSLLEKNNEIQTSENSDLNLASTTENLTSTSTDNIAATSSKTKPILTNPKVNINNFLTMTQKQVKYKKAPELSGISGYINTDGKPITLASLKGQVVLLDIWTYSCINCQRTLPYVTSWYSKYKDQGFVVIGIHTPEFSFEKLQTNVEKAVKDFNIKYPVVLDNNYSTWQSLGNQYWPRKYLIDMDGYIVYDHIGEGSYEETEKAIQQALLEKANRMGTKDTLATTTSQPNNTILVDSSKVKSPEVYFGSARNNYLGNGISGIAGEQNLTIPNVIDTNKLYLSGDWNFVSEYAENKSATTIVFKYDAKNVYMAAGAQNGVEIEIYKDDVFLKKILIKDETLYPLIQDSDYGLHILKIVIPKAGLQAFTFTFG